MFKDLQSFFILLSILFCLFFSLKKQITNVAAEASSRLKQSQQLQIEEKAKRLLGFGYGFDFLTAEQAAYPLVNISYSKEQKTNDHKYAVPDCFVVEERRGAALLDTAELIDSAKQYAEPTFKSSIDPMSSEFASSETDRRYPYMGSFSSKFQEMFAEQARSKTITLRSVYSERRYTLMLNSDCRLNEAFESLVNEIAACLQVGDNEWAKYLAHELIRDFGTHYARKASLGGTFAF
jgi:hypothetical protein